MLSVSSVHLILEILSIKQLIFVGRPSSVYIKVQGQYQDFKEEGMLALRSMKLTPMRGLGVMGNLPEKFFDLRWCIQGFANKYF